MRKVSVALVADVADFVKFIGSAKKSVDDLGDEVDQLDRSINKLPPDAAKAGAALKLLGGDADAVGKKFQDLGEKNTTLAVLESKIKDTRTEVRKLSEEFVKTGDVEIFKKLGDAEGRLRHFLDLKTKIKNIDVGPEIEGWFARIGKKIATGTEAIGEQFGKLLPDALSGALQTPVLGPIIAVGLIAAILAAVDIALANVGGLILAGAGAGIVAGGIIGAILGDPKTVGDAWSKELASVKTEFIDATQPVRQPLLDAAHEFGATLRGIDMASIFAPAAQWLPMLVKGASDFVRYLALAGQYLSQGAGPEVKVLAEELPQLGAAFASASKAIAGGSEGGAIALRDLLGVIEMIIAGIGGWIGAAEKVYGEMAKLRDTVIPRDWFFPPEASQHVETYARAIHGAGDELKSFVPDLDEANRKLNETSVTMDSIEASIVNKIFTATMGLDQAFLHMNESLTQLSESFKKNGRELDIHKEKGQANREAVLSAVQANMELYQAQVHAGMSAEDAAKAYDENTAALEAQLRKAGLTAGQIDDLIGKYRGIPHKVDTTIAIEGLTKAINELNETIRLINGLHDKTIIISYKAYGSPKGQSRLAPERYGGIRRAAEGMVVGPSDPGTVLFGEPETGGEAFIPLRGISQSRAMALAQTVGDSYGFSVSSGGGARSLSLTIAFAGNTSDAMAASIQQLFYDQKIQVFAGGQPVRVQR